jgi:hypothetical protein
MVVDGDVVGCVPDVEDNTLKRCDTQSGTAEDTWYVLLFTCQVIMYREISVVKRTIPRSVSALADQTFPGQLSDLFHVHTPYRGT